MDSAFAAPTSDFRRLLQDLNSSRLLERLHGADLSHIMEEMKKLPNGINHTTEMYHAAINMHRVGGSELIAIFQPGRLKSFLRKNASGQITHGTTMEELVHTLAEIDVEALSAAQKGKLAGLIQGLEQTPSSAIGSAHHLKDIRNLQKESKVIEGIEVEVETGFGFRRIYDTKITGQFRESKTWDPANAKKYIQKYISGDSKNNPQLAADLVLMMESGPNSVRWVMNAEVDIAELPKLAREAIEKDRSMMAKMIKLSGAPNEARFFEQLDDCLAAIFIKLE